MSEKKNRKKIISSDSEVEINSPRKSIRKISPNKRYIEEGETSRKISKLKNDDVNYSPKTPKKDKVIDKNIKTPHHLRKQLKNKLSKIQQKLYEEDDFSGSESDFKPSNSSSENESSLEESSSEENESQSDEKILPQHKKTNNLKSQNDFVLQSDEYFSHYTNNKAFTSNRTLESLKIPRLDHDELFNLLKTLKISKDHENSISEMMVEYKSYFNKWMLLLDEGFSILLYGLGSKKKLLQNFHEERLSKHDVIVVNGFFPGLNFKDILDNIANKIMDLKIPTSNFNLVVDIIEEQYNRGFCHNIFLIINNIDGIMLRNDIAQTILSRLARIKNIYIIASIDHIYAPLLWNTAKLANYNFSWFDVTTMLPYSDETAYENSLLIQNSGALTLLSMKNVFQSLTINAKGIYKIIVKHQTENNKQNYQGMAFKELYSKCREAFLVSTDLVLRSQLTEFLDHKLVKLRRGNDGTEYLNIPIETKLLQQFLNQEKE